MDRKAEMVPRLDTIQDNWAPLYKLLQRFMTGVHPELRGELNEEIIRFNTLLSGDLYSFIALFRDSLDQEKARHAIAKNELRAAETIYTTRPHTYIRPLPSTAPPSPISDWGGESS